MSKQITIGTRIYYTGDMANQPGWFTVTKILPANKYSQESAQMTEDADGEDRTQNTPTFMIGHVYKGHCGTRFVTEAAHQAWKSERMAEWNKHIA